MEGISISRNQIKSLFVLFADLKKKKKVCYMVSASSKQSLGFLIYFSALHKVVSLLI